METFNYFSGWVLPSLQRSPFCGTHRVHTGTGWGQYQLLQLSCVSLRLDKGQCLHSGNNGASFVSPLFDLHEASSHIWAERWDYRVAVSYLFAGPGLAVGRQGVLAPLGVSEPPLPTGTCSLRSFPSAAEGHCACDSQSKSLHPHKPLASG